MNIDLQRYLHEVHRLKRRLKDVLWFVDVVAEDQEEYIISS